LFDPAAAGKISFAGTGPRWYDVNVYFSLMTAMREAAAAWILPSPLADAAPGAAGHHLSV
jgi:hypothetical protein